MAPFPENESKIPYLKLCLVFFVAFRQRTRPEFPKSFQLCHTIKSSHGGIAACHPLSPSYPVLPRTNSLSVMLRPELQDLRGWRVKSGEPNSVSREESGRHRGPDPGLFLLNKPQMPQLNGGLMLRSLSLERDQRGQLDHQVKTQEVQP